MQNIKAPSVLYVLYILWNSNSNATDERLLLCIIVYNTIIVLNHNWSY